MIYEIGQGFCQKHNAKSLLEKKFSIDTDYINLAPEASGARKHGGNNKIKIMLIVKTFKSMCLKAGTKKADEILFHCSTKRLRNSSKKFKTTPFWRRNKV